VLITCQWIFVPFFVHPHIQLAITCMSFSHFMSGHMVAPEKREGQKNALMKNIKCQVICANHSCHMALRGKIKIIKNIENNSNPFSCHWPHHIPHTLSPTHTHIYIFSINFSVHIMQWLSFSAWCHASLCLFSVTKSTFYLFSFTLCFSYTNTYAHT
jgi:hypothetical protein